MQVRLSLERHCRTTKSKTLLHIQADPTARIISESNDVPPQSIGTPGGRLWILRFVPKFQRSVRKYPKVVGLESVICNEIPRSPQIITALAYAPGSYLEELLASSVSKANSGWLLLPSTPLEPYTRTLHPQDHSNTGSALCWAQAVFRRSSGDSTLDYAYHPSLITLRQTAAGTALRGRLARRCTLTKFACGPAVFPRRGASFRNDLEVIAIAIECASLPGYWHGCVYSNPTLGFLRTRKVLFTRAQNERWTRNTP